MNHDQNFKNLILDYPREALAFFAAEEGRELHGDTRIIPIRQEQLKERLGDRFRELDVPLLVEWPGGEREALLFILEEESNPKRFSIHRLAHYCLDLAELFKTDRIVPVVIFLRKGRFPKKLELGGQRHHYLNFHYLDCNLGELPFERFQHSDNIVARLNLPNMCYPADKKIDAYAQAVRGLTTLEPHPEKVLKYLDFIDIYTSLDDNERQLYEKRYPDEARQMSTFAERFIEKGMQQGMEQGMQKGMQQGEAAALLKLLGLKFSEVPDNIRQRIETAETETLLEWLGRVLTAQSINEVVEYRDSE
ncbi:MAG TPA: hypothetical protein ENJ84_07115 [Gammaproteobacteria bacterium]|nr:hypothetical protein [Gammaproteobacteria bacterium]